jgi:hypothetical protein
MTFSLVIYAAVVVLLAGALGGCSGGGGSGGGSLDAALARVVDTAINRSQISYDNTAELVRLSGTGPGPANGPLAVDLGPTKGFAVLRGWGSGLYLLLNTLAGATGISVLKEDYAISVGPQMLTLLQGGQSGSLVTSRLTRLGWKQHGGTLVGPVFPHGSRAASEFEPSMHVVRTSGSDVTFEAVGDDLGQIGSPTGDTLASDPVIKALASCLGDVVAAQLGVGRYLGGRRPVGVGVGIRTPSSNSATPRAVACVAWSSQAAATQYTADARKALTSGLSADSPYRPYATVLSHPSVTDIGGSRHIVRWEADTANRASLILQLYENGNLPGLPTCTRLSPTTRKRVFGCP